MIPVLLVILDGVGCRDAAPDNPVSLARKPNWDRLWQEFAHTTIDASERSVGLPSGQMGNSEVGHLNIGAGRVIYQDFTRIDRAIETGEFATNPVLAEAVAIARRNNATLHVLGLLSLGGVHSHERQIAAMVRMAADGGAPHVRVHAFLDGRDTPPRSAGASLATMAAVCAASPVCAIADIVGRYYAMDRDHRWERIQVAYELIVDGVADYSAPDAQAALAAAYARAENVSRRRVPKLGAFVCLTSYGDAFAHLPAAFTPQSINHGFGEMVAERGLKQLRIAETEKYAHVTYFFNGGVEAVYPGEDRILVPSPKVATYDLKPEMSAVEVTDKLVAAIASDKYHAIVCNYANGDMVGHTGNVDAARQAIEVLDECIGHVVSAQRARGGEALITADHGNVEMMHDPATGQAHTAHTLNLVPCLYVGRPAQMETGGALQDIAPTLLAMMGLPQPEEMTGRSLIQFTQ